MQTPPYRPPVSFGMPGTPFDPGTGRFAALEDVRETASFLVIEEFDDYLKCEEADGSVVYVAKPMMLRLTPFDGQTVDGKDYEYSDTATRTVDGEEQSLTPPYIEEEEYIVAARFRYGVWSPEPSESESPGEESSTICQPMIGPGGGKILWEDLNTAGRTWIPDSDGGVAGGIDQWVEVTKTGDCDLDSGDWRGKAFDVRVLVYGGSAETANLAVWTDISGSWAAMVGKNSSATEIVYDGTTPFGVTIRVRVKDTGELNLHVPASSYGFQCRVLVGPVTPTVKTGPDKTI